MTRVSDPDREAAVFRTGRRDPKVVSLQEVRKQKHQRKSKSGEFLTGRIQLAPTSSDAPVEIAGRKQDPALVLSALADAEIFVLLQDDPDSDAPTAKVVSRKNAKFVLVFENREMITKLAGDKAQGAPMIGEKLFRLLRGRGVGIAVNLGDLETATLISAENLETHCAKNDPETEDPVTITAEPENEDLPPAEAASPESKNTALFKALLAPTGIPDGLAVALVEQISDAKNICDRALLIRAEYQDGTAGFLVVFSGVNLEDRDTITSYVGEALEKSGRDDVVLDISFLNESDPILERLRRVALVLNPS